MQLISQDGNMKVDFYPAANLTNRFVKVVTFCNDQQSEKLITKRDMEYDIEQRLALGYDVTMFHTKPMMKHMVCC